MACFTKSTADQAPLIHVDATKKLSKVNPNTYGGFTEHMGRCIYGGIYEPTHHSADENGFRKDVIEALREIDVPVMRYPGGNFVATYHWQEGIGPREKRPSRPELAWLGVESNQFGTDEFMKWLEVLSEGKEQRVEPYICLNFGTGTLDEALAWLEYCNGTRDTYWANQRRANGHPEPYNVKYWALGNEVWGPWQVLQMTKEDYAKQAIQWAKALRLMDPSIELILCGENGTSSWDHYVLHEAVDWVNMHSIHIYTASADHNKNVTAPLSAERAIEITASLIDLARIEKGVSPTKPPVTICFDEWNVWDPERAPGDQGAEEKYTLSDALAVAVWLNVFIRQSKYVGMANIAQTVNVISPLMTTEKGVVRQSTWWPLYLYSKYMRGHTLATHVRGPVYEGATSPAWLQGTLAATQGGISWLDVSATLEADGLVSLAVVNMNDIEDFSVELDGLVSGEVTVYKVSGESVQSTNVEDKEEVGLDESKWDGKGKFTFPKHTFIMLRWKA